MKVHDVPEELSYSITLPCDFGILYWKKFAMNIHSLYSRIYGLCLETTHPFFVNPTECHGQRYSASMPMLATVYQFAGEEDDFILIVRPLFNYMARSWEQEFRGIKSLREAQLVALEALGLDSLIKFFPAREET